ncbi:protein Skeletor, isoforms B/C-like [Penaeus indicus]|uniref:protein Skeletor, isoforms B/C-like n=1 Tax=Penaeus indicus TaxID=29960 RepID=UPI00300CC764
MGRERIINKVRLCLATLAFLATGGDAAGYFGRLIGQLEPLHHQVQGEVYAVDSRTIHIRGFSYDGTAPDAFFYGGSTPNPSEAGFIIPDENGGVQPLGRYRNQDITLTLPDGKTLKDITWISVWCRAFAIDFGNVRVPARLDYPRPQKIDALPTFEHGVSSDRIVVVDAQTFLIPNFSYDGQAPDGHFWVGRGATPGPSGNMVPDENGSEEPLKRYSGKTIVITLPGDQTVFDIDHLSVWCRAFFADFGHVRVPKNLNVPPSLKMLGVAPQTKLNCEVLWDDLAFEVRWAVAGESIVMQLVGRIDNGQYMAFGPSGSLTRSVMVGGDVVVAWLNQGSGEGVASDYYLGAKAQCQGGRGSCPDDKIRGSSNNVRLLNAALINDFTMLTFQRPLRAVDASDTGILTNGSQAVIWAVGPVNSQGDTSYHSLRLRGDMFIDFGRTPKWNCPLPEEQGAGGGLVSGPATPPPAPPTNNAWYIPPVPCYEPADGVFYAQIGPSGGQSGYNAITGHVGWGVAWYINGLLIPEINVVRGKTYTFVVEGGYDPERPARYHPFYITDDPEGGYEFKTPAERQRTRVFAGVGQDRDGVPVPTAYGRLCEWTENPNQPADAFESFGAYQRTLQLDCQEGQPGILQWTPDAATPDTVFYQCYTHRYLGWKINVVDACDFEPLEAAGTVGQPVVVPGPQEDGEDMVVAESAQVFTSDGTRLAPESLPTPPELTTRPRVTGASITNRPQVVPFRGELPPPIPDRVPHLPQFSPQTRPQSRKTTVPPPPLPADLSPEMILPQQQDDPRRRVAPALLRHQELSADIGRNRILAVSDFPTTAEAYAPTRPPTTPRSAASASEASNRTKLTILKDVWAILTRDNPSLRPEHPRDDAHPDHAHDPLDRQERRRRDATEAQTPSGSSSSSGASPPPKASVGAATHASSLAMCAAFIAFLALAR